MKDKNSEFQMKESSCFNFREYEGETIKSRIQGIHQEILTEVELFTYKDIDRCFLKGDDV